MTTLTMPPPKAASVPKADESPIHLFQLGALITLRISQWSFRAGNEPSELELSPERIRDHAISSFGTKDLIDPCKGRKVFQFIEKRARQALAKHSRPFPAAGAHFVPWKHVPALTEALESLKSEYQSALDAFIEDYPTLRGVWQATHPEVPDSAYPPVWEMRERFDFRWHTFKVAGAEAQEVENLEGELAKQRVQEEQLQQFESELQAECQQFVAEYVRGFRREVADFCDQVIAANGEVHGKTLQAIRRRIDRFAAMNIFGDSDATAKLAHLKSQIVGLTGEELAQKPEVALQLHSACSLLRREIMDESSLSSLTGRLKRRVVLD